MAMLYETVAAVRDLVSMEEAAAYYGLQFNRAGFAVCPFHSEKTASFKIHKGRGHCFGCGWHGDAIDFVQRLYNIDRAQAVRTLIQDFRLPVPLDEDSTIRQRQEMYQRAAALRAERERQRREDQERLDAYHAALDRFALLDKWKRDYAPQSPEDPIDPRYAEACKYLEAARAVSIERG